LEWGKSSVRNFCAIRVVAIDGGDFGLLPPTIEHLAYGPPRQVSITITVPRNGGVAIDPEIVPLQPWDRLPESLRTVTLVLPADLLHPYKELEASFREHCAARGIALSVVLEGGDNVFDCEEWARSVGA
jgi:hypothetical protein